MNRKIINNSQYIEFEEKLKIEIADFFRDMAMGRTVRNHALRSRKKSIRLRKLLKEFRQISLDNDKRLNLITKNAKKEIKEGK